MHNTKDLKPWQLVSFTFGETTAIGELVSYPTPAGTIMLRAIPRNETSLVEIPLTAILRLTPEYRYVHYAAVAPMAATQHASLIASFPIDMLRYDCAVPLNFTLDEEDVPTLRTGWENSPLIVASCALNKTAPFTIARWNSFLWSCVEAAPPEPIGNTFKKAQ